MMKRYCVLKNSTLVAFAAVCAYTVLRLSYYEKFMLGNFSVSNVSGRHLFLVEPKHRELVWKLNPEKEFQCSKLPQDEFVYAPTESRDHLWPLGARPVRSLESCTLPQAPTTNPQDVVGVPITPFHACNNQVPRLTCHYTIILDSTTTPSDVFPVPRVSGLMDSVCQDIVEKKTKAVMVCMQTADTLDALVHPNNSSLSTSFKYVFPAEAQALVEEWQRRGFGARLVQRQVVGINWMYTERDESSDRIRSVNSNLGNHIWMFGATRMVNPATTLLVQSSSNTDLNALGQPTAYILALANHLDVRIDLKNEKALGRWTELVEDNNVPTIVLGIGIQIDPGRDHTDVKYFPYLTKFLKAVEDHQSKPAIGTRGKATTKVCENSGITHCVPLGCPSLTISRQDNLGQKMQEKWNKAGQKLKMGKKLRLAIALPAHYRREILDFFWSLHRQHDVVFIPQDQKDDKIVLEHYEKYASKNDVAPKFRVFNNTEEWLDYMEDEIEFVVSSRIHGSMGAISAGTPAVVIPTDTRIMELLDAMHIPHLKLDQFAKEKPKNLIDCMKLAHNTNFDGFEANRIKRLSEWKDILAEANIEMDPKLDQIRHHLDSSKGSITAVY